MWVAPDEVSLESLEASELASTPMVARCAIRLADALARQGVAYRHDGNLAKTDLDRPPLALSCSELVYYVYARCGVDLGDAHMRTRFLAYADPPPYSASMARVTDGSILPGDLLVYHWERSQVEQWLAERGRTRPGHVVIAVSPSRGMVIGSHGRESTPEGALRGVGYRILPDGFGIWTEGRPLRAVYRLNAGTSTLTVARTSTITD
jgi:cell wall-associated NlpC family hydrolase